QQCTLPRSKLRGSFDGKLYPPLADKKRFPVFRRGGEKRFLTIPRGFALMLWGALFRPSDDIRN
ncbi:MAG: hypothetical protein AAB362_01415, partial [Patescibacteria group bacterium]